MWLTQAASPASGSVHSSSPKCLSAPLFSCGLELSQQQPACWVLCVLSMNSKWQALLPSSQVPSLGRRPSPQSNLPEFNQQCTVCIWWNSYKPLLSQLRMPSSNFLFTLCPWLLSPFGFHASKFQGFLTSTSRWESQERSRRIHGEKIYSQLESGKW